MFHILITCLLQFPTFLFIKTDCQIFRKITDGIRAKTNTAHLMQSVSFSNELNNVNKGGWACQG